MFFIKCNRHTNQVKILLQRTVRMFHTELCKNCGISARKRICMLLKLIFILPGWVKVYTENPLSYLEQNWSKVSEIQPL